MMFEDEEIEIVQGSAWLPRPMVIFFFLPHQSQFITDECGQGSVTILGIRMRCSIVFQGKTDRTA